MNRLTISPNEAVYYQYDPENDALEVRFQPGDGPAREEPLAEMPLVSLLRNLESGTILGVRVSSVQQFLLQKLVQELATLASAYVGIAPAIEVAETQPEAAPPSSRRSRSRKKREEEGATPIAEEVAPAQPVEVAAEAESLAPIEAAAEAPPEAHDEAAATADLPTPSAEIVEAVEAAPVPVEEAPARSSRSRSRKKKEEPQAVTAEPVAEMVAAPEAAPTKARRSRSRKKSEPEAEAMAVAESSVASVVAPAEAEVPIALPEAEEAPPKARRSRSRKKKSEPEAVSTAEVDEPLALEAVPPATEVESIAAEQEPSEEAALVEGADEEEPSKSRRRRNRKKKKATSEPEEALPLAAAPVEPLTIEAEPAAEGAVEDKSAKRKRRRKRKRGKGTGEAEVALPATQPAPQPQPVAARESGRAQQPQPTKEKRDSDVTRSPYKTAPIPGLETPDAFGFMNMNRLLGQAVAALGFEEPTPIQRRAVPIGMTGRDIIGLAQTGTGKTMAFLIPAVHRLLMDKNQAHRPRLLTLVPTRELAVQVAEEAEFLATHTDLHISTIYGGVSIDAQTKDLRRGTDIIVATPGRLLDHLNRGNVKLDTVEVLVLDEADRMLDMGFLPEIRTIVRRVPTERQTLLFSATMPPAIQSLSMDFQRDPEVIEVARQLPPATIEQHLYPVERHLKTPLLVYLLQSDPAMNSVLVFTETKIEADVLARKLREADIRVGLMHGDRSQREREEALHSLRTGTVRALVATDVAARGLDINDISHVVNYDIPQTVDSYVHRIGRTARGEAEGKAYTFVSSADEGMVKRIESALERKLPRTLAEGFNYDVPTPSWAKPSSDEIIESLNQPKGLAERFRRMIRRS